MKKEIKNIIVLENIIATIRDAKTGKVKRVYKHKNSVQLAGRNVIARRLVNELTYSGILNYGVLYTAGPVENYRKLIASGTYDDASAKAYATWFFTAAEVNGTFVQWGNVIDGAAGSGTGQQWSITAVSWTKSALETLTVDCIYQITAV